jgi:hypothetical protein
VATPSQSCRERVLLLEEVGQAIRRSYQAMEEHDRAAMAKQDVTLLSQALAEARRVERTAVAKLKQHREDHGC